MLKIHYGVEKNSNDRGWWHSGKDCPPLPLGRRACPPSLFDCYRPWHWDLTLTRVLAALAAQSSAPARNSNYGACYAAVLSRPAGLSGVSVLSGSELAKYYQLQQVLRDANACAIVVIAAWWTKLRRTSGDLKDLDKLGIYLEISLAVNALSPPPVDSVVTVIWAPMEALNQLDAAVDFILPLSPTSPSKAGSRNPAPPLSHLLIQLRTVSE